MKHRCITLSSSVDSGDLEKLLEEAILLILATLKEKEDVERTLYNNLETIYLQLSSISNLINNITNNNLVIELLTKNNLVLVNNNKNTDTIASQQLTIVDLYNIIANLTHNNEIISSTNAQLLEEFNNWDDYISSKLNEIIG